MSNVETNLIKPFPVAFSGHTLKYEIECICKIFLPMRKFTFLYDTTQLPADAEEGAVLILEQLGEQSRFWVQVQYRGQVMEQEQQFPACSPETEKQLCEYRFSAMLFRLLEEITDLHPAWGLLTGIRPVKKVQPLLGQGLSKAEVCEKLHEKYWIAPEKLSLVYDTAMVQQPLLEKTPKHGISLYVSIPFCPTRCSYCSFVSHSIAQAQNLIPAYLEKLCEELKIWGQLVREQELLVDTVYFGGGTPTSLTAAQLEQVLTAVQESFDLSHLREYCVEAGRPDTITSEKLQTLRRFGVDRISVNPQTMQDHVLETIGRKHTTAQTVEAFRMARAAGFENINMDLIAGLPDDTPEGFHDTLEQILALDPDSITVHALTLKRAANLFAEGEQQVHNPVEQMVQESMRRLPEHGYAPYYMYRQKIRISEIHTLMLRNGAIRQFVIIMCMVDSMVRISMAKVRRDLPYISRKKRNMRVDFSSICLRHRKVKMRQKVRRARIIKLPLHSHMEHILWFPIRADLC